MTNSTNSSKCPNCDSPLPKSSPQELCPACLMRQALVSQTIASDESKREARFAERFAREAEILAQLNHPHIVTIHDFGEVDGLFFLVMEFVDGVNLRDLISDGSWNRLEP